MWRNRIIRKSLVVILFFSSTYLFLYTYFYDSEYSLNQLHEKTILFDKQINEILHQTPYLWRKFEFDEDETVSSRINAQISWIKNIQMTDFIQSAPVKRILVQDGMDLYYGTHGKLQCPYAPDFEGKCILIPETWMDKVKGNLKYEHVDAAITVRNWEDRITDKIPFNVQQIMYILEPPHIAKSAQLGINNALLASYWRGSDIPLPYRQWYSNNETTQRKGSQEIITNSNNKTKMVVAIISNCESENNRLSYIRELQKHIEVDVYGKCGNLNCSKSTNQDCLTMIGNKYKFFLSFENSNCFDYITEKFFDNALKNRILPIVMGGRPDDYETAAPPFSYIHVNDFESPKELANYLHTLDRDPELYQQYFKWVGTGYIGQTHLEDFFCRLCGMLFYADFISPPKWNSSTTSWKEVNQCLPAEQWYWR